MWTHRQTVVQAHTCTLGVWSEFTCDRLDSSMCFQVRKTWLCRSISGSHQCGLCIASALKHLIHDTSVHSMAHATTLNLWRLKEFLSSMISCLLNDLCPTVSVQQTSLRPLIANKNLASFSTGNHQVFVINWIFPLILCNLRGHDTCCSSGCVLWILLIIYIHYVIYVYNEDTYNIQLGQMGSLGVAVCCTSVNDTTNERDQTFLHTQLNCNMSNRLQSRCLHLWCGFECFTDLTFLIVCVFWIYVVHTIHEISSLCVGWIPLDLSHVLI